MRALSVYIFYFCRFHPTSIQVGGIEYDDVVRSMLGKKISGGSSGFPICLTLILLSQ